MGSVYVYLVSEIFWGTLLLRNTNLEVALVFESHRVWDYFYLQYELHANNLSLH